MSRTTACVSSGVSVEAQAYVYAALENQAVDEGVGNALLFSGRKGLSRRLKSRCFP